MRSVTSSNRGLAANRLYEVFARYTSPGQGFCTFCYTPEDINHITTTPISVLDAEHGRKLLWEAADHWESADVYRHYLPRILELLGPPWSVEDLYPLHLSETLIALGFREWPEEEREAVLEQLEHLRSVLDPQFDAKDRKNWLAGIAALKSQTLALPASLAESNDDDA